MIFFCLALFLLTFWLGPWWLICVESFCLGWFQPQLTKGGLQPALACAAAWAALGFIEDGLNYGFVSKRIAALFSLPSPVLVFVLLAVLGFVTTYLSIRAATALRSALNS